MSDVQEKLKGIIREMRELDANVEIEDSTSLASLEFDSLDVFNLLFACEEQLGVDLEDLEIDDTKLVFGDLVKMIEGKQ